MLEDVYNSKEYKLSELRRKFEGVVVMYNNTKYLMYKLNDSGKCQLLDINLVKCSGTPLLKNVFVIGKLPRVYFNRGYYLLTKTKDIVSCRTGDVVYKEDSQQRRDIMYSFKQEIQ